MNLPMRILASSATVAMTTMATIYENTYLLNVVRFAGVVMFLVSGLVLLAFCCDSGRIRKVYRERQYAAISRIEDAVNVLLLVSHGFMFTGGAFLFSWFVCELIFAPPDGKCVGCGKDISSTARNESKSA